MKNLLHLQKYFLKGCLFLLLFTGCIKDPGPDIPLPVNKPEWLLTKFTEVSANGDPIYGELSYHKLVTEYKYNQYYKPSLQLVYAPVNYGDTVTLRVYYRDTLYYDRLLRVTQVSRLNNANKVTGTRKFTYKGNDTLPGSLEVAYYDSIGNPTYTYSFRYEYLGDTAVIVLRPNSKGYDSTKYVYEGGNYTRQCLGEGFSNCTDKYIGHNGRNVGLFLNLSHGLALEIPDTEESPRISLSNWQLKDNIDHFRGMTFNEHGLLVRAGWYNYVPEYSITCRFEYMKVE